MLRSFLWMVLALGAGTAFADDSCLRSGNQVSLSGMVAERRIDPQGDGRDVRVYVLRTAEPICIGSGGSGSRTDKLQLTASRESALLSALARVSGGKVRVVGTLSSGNAGPRHVAPDVVTITEAYDLEAGGGEVVLEPEIPISVRFRKALLSSGLVASFKNETEDPFAVTLEFSRESTDRRDNRDLVLNKDQSREIGEREGWAFVKDDKIVLSRKGYKPVTIVVPEL